ncbi:MULTISPECIES: carbohydrate ABC transporter permease [Vibrio]|uniref:Maltose/maltodextrin transport system permease protein n=3 Tax=Vibrio TaxID=662 RepID=A0A2N7NF99_9VIBR|nr:MULTISPECIES: sugar ABC transporter permease [Vibrio]EAQ53946.1 maltose:maltodextrin transport system permease [Vibrio sp. MED222]MCZ4310584.1 sugar ABC transporter permease [Vibrio atlanticus]OEF46912.1 sugar ABC transporter permease [Vibrio tasmaniensis 1F-267]OEF60841.1 sugar ABC transporter permease [Vibrio tasmaniensis 1F-187]PML46041.1 sugar ABC transporter permease [Vibrio tasmaniensis]
MLLTENQPASRMPASLLIMGSTQIVKGHWIKGGVFLAMQLITLLILPELLASLKGLVTLGDVAQVREGFKILQGDNSVFMLVEGVIALLYSFLFICLYIANVQDAKVSLKSRLNLREQFKDIYDQKFAFIMLSPAFIASIAFIILPIIITVLVSFTNYSAPHHIPPRNLVDWVGFKNFVSLFELKIWSSTFFGVASWTVLWAFFATICTCGFGFLLALALQNRNIKAKKAWRFIFILPYAIPAFVTLLMFRLLLNGIGPVNATLNSWGFDSIAFLSDPFTAKITVIAVSVWVGAPYFMLLIAGALTNISSELYEASEVDGASKFQQFKEITLPMVLHQVAPSLVMTFAHNFNNFGAIYLLTEGGPINPEYRFAGHTDILITWIYKLTLDFQQYQIASVISIIIFLFLSGIAIWQFSRMKSFKDDVGM